MPARGRRLSIVSIGPNNEGDFALALRRAASIAPTEPDASGPPLSAVEVLQRAGMSLPRTLDTPDGNGGPPSQAKTLSPTGSQALTEGPRMSRTAFGNADTMDLTKPSIEAPPPEEIGRYRLQRMIGAGGMGQVWQGWDRELSRTVAIKLIRFGRGLSVDHVRRFVAEARITSQLQHPNIVPVHDFGVTRDGTLFFVMKRVEGSSLREALDDVGAGEPEAARRWTQARLLRAFVQIGQAIAYAHDRGVLHRDLKPANIMLGPFGEVLVMDWGLARLWGELEEEVAGEDGLATTSGTQFGSVLGTPGYMPPEQLEGRLDQLDARTDVWALGAILYELLTGQRAHEARTLAVLRAQMARGVVDPRVRAPQLGIDPEIAEITMCALHPVPSQRYASATELVAAVEDFLEGSRRREAALEELDHARVAWSQHHGLRQAEQGIRRDLRFAERSVKAWAPLDDPAKAQLLTLRESLRDAEAAAADALGQALAGAERALAHADVPEGHAFLAESYWSLLQDAELRRDVGDQAFFRRRLEQHDRGRFTPKLEQAGMLTLRTHPPGAEVTCERYERRGLVWPLGPARVVGRTPMMSAPLDQGSYLLTVRAAGHEPVRYPVLIDRGGHVDGGDPLWLPKEGELPDGAVYVPSGWASFGGDPELQVQLAAERSFEPGFAIGRHPVTAAEYAEFLAELPRAEQAARVPRKPRARDGGQAGYWPLPADDGPLRFPFVDAEGDEWAADWPVFAVSWHDAVAYCAWRSERDGLRVSVPTGRQWERAARGADGRFFPWGDQIDAQLCVMSGTRKGARKPEPVGAVDSDVSVFGVRDCAGTMREWMGDDSFDSDPTRRPVRGGWWLGTDRMARVAHRFGFVADAAHGYIGFRVVWAVGPRGLLRRGS